MIEAEKLRLTIIIPVRNGEKTIGSCLDSLLRQTVQVDEIIVVDDNSTDATMAICMEYAEKNHQITWYSSASRGVSAARNIGLNKAHGDIIGFCDADDCEKDHMCEVVKKHFCTYHETEMLITGYEKVYALSGGRCRIVPASLKHNVSSYWKRNDIAKRVIYDDRVMGSVWNKFFRAEIIKDVRFDEKLTLCEDMEFNLNAIYKCSEKSIYVTDMITYRYFYNEESVTSNIDTEHQFDKTTKELNYNISFWEILNDNYISEDVRKCLRYKIFVYSLNAICFYDVDPEQEFLLKEHIRENLSCFFSQFWILPVINTKQLIKYVFRFKRLKPFSW